MPEAAKVLIGPAEIAFTRILSPPKSTAKERTLASSAAFTRNVEIVSLELFSIRKSNGMDNKVKGIPLFFKNLKGIFNPLFFTHITVKNKGRSNRVSKGLYTFFEGIPLIGKSKLRPMLGKGLCNSPSNGHVVGNTHNKATFARH